MGYERLLLDIETQQDFFDPTGNCYDRSAARAASNIYRLFNWAKRNDIPVLSTVLRVRRGEIGPLCSRPHCIEGTEGEQKLSGTLLPRRINLGLRNTTDLPRDLFEIYQQVIVEKRDTNLFSHARLERLITELEANTFIICGAGIARGIVQAAVGLRSRNFGVILASDAVADLDDPMNEMAYLRMEAKRVVMAPTKEIVTPHKIRRPGRFKKTLHAR